MTAVARSLLPFVVLAGALGFAGGAPSRASAQATLLNGFGGTRGFGPSCLGPNDDGSSAVIDLAPAFPSGLRFFDRTHTRVYVNNNGNITFSGPLGTYTPDAFPVAGQPMIAPYWADVDTRAGRGTCTLFSDGTGAGAATCLNPSQNGVWWYLEPGRMIVTWDQVGYYRCNTDKRMSFQLVLTAATATCGGAGDFDVEFRYNQCEWTTGDASGGTRGFGGTQAQAGFDAGNSRDFVMIMGSRTDMIHTILCSMSNVGETGIWRFQIRSGVVVCPGAGDACDTGMLGACAEGRMQCVGAGTSCVPDVTATSERCDAIDNDCNGAVDDGSGLCSGTEVCDRGSCVAPCFEGGCPAGKVCSVDGRCVDIGCEDLTCASGQRCEAGACVGACDGVMCPAGLACRSGRCVDPCERLTCDDCTVCADGSCVPRCSFAPCPSGQTCLADGSCVEDACATVMCAVGTVCRGGTCVDACAGAVCPSGESCETGACVPGESVDGGPIVRRDGGTIGSDGGVIGVDGSIGVDAGCLGLSCPGASMRDEGCGCRVGGVALPERAGAGGARIAASLVAALAAICFARRQRRRRSARASRADRAPGA